MSCALQGKREEAQSEMSPQEYSSFGIVKDEKGTQKLEFGDPKKLQEIFGTRTVYGACIALKTLAIATYRTDDLLEECQLALMAEFQPKTPSQTLLVSQMTITQAAIVRASIVFNGSSEAKDQEIAERSLTRLSRTHLAQIELFERLRKTEGKGGNVTVQDGGKAIVGSTICYSRHENQR